MSNPKYKWDQPSTPPPPMFFGSKERDLVKQVNDELAERVIGQTVAYYPISIEESNFNEIYGEAIDKVSLPPVRVYAYVEVENVQTTEKFGYEYQTKLVVNFHRRRLTEDQNLYVRVGDFLQYGDQFYEIVRTYNDTRYYFGQVQHKFQISAECVKARRGLFRVMPSVDRPGDDVAAPGEGSATPAPRPAPYPPLDASYIVVSGTPKLPNDREIAAGSNISITDGGPNSTITIAAVNVGNASAQGPVSSLQFQTGSGAISGTADFTFLSGSSALILTGTMDIVGAFSASTTVSASAFYGDGSNLSGITTSPAGSTTEIQYNSAGSFAASSNLTFDGTTLTGSFSGSLAELTTLSASLMNLAPTSGTLAGPGSYLGLDTSNNVVLSAGDGASASPAGSNTEIQFNDAGSFGGSANLTYNSSTNFVALSGSMAVSGGNVTILSTDAGAGTASPPDGFLIFDKVFDNSGAHTANKIVLYDDGGVGASWKGGIGVSYLSVDFYSGDNFNFWTDHGSAQQGDNRFTILTNGNVGIGTDAPGQTLEVAGDAGFNEYLYHNGDGDTYIRFAPNLVNVVAGGWSAIKLEKSTGKIQLNNGNQDLDVQMMADDGEVILHTDAGTNRVGINTDAPTYALDVAGDAGFNEYIYHNGDTNTFIRFEPDKINIEAGAENMIYMVSGSGGDQNAKVAINNDGVDVDFQVKGLGEANLIRTDALNDRVGIGVYPASASLHVLSSDAGPVLQIDSTGSAPLLFVTGSGRVGIGTTSPGKTLTVEGEISASSAIYGTDLTLKTSAADNIASIYIEGTAGTEIIGFGDGAMNIRSDGGALNLLGGTGNELRFGSDDVDAKMVLDTDGNLGIGTGTPTSTLHVSSSGDAALFRVDGAAAGNVLFVTGSGRVGIGTAAPDSALHVYGTSHPQMIVEGDDHVQLNLVGTAGNHVMMLFDNSGGASGTKWYIGQDDLPNPTDDGFSITHTTNASPQFYIHTDGNVGIGLTGPAVSLIPPTAKLQVSSSGDQQLFRVDGATEGAVLFVTGSGRVGIGTETPGHSLTVIGASHLSGGVVHKRTSVTNNYSIALTDYYLGVDTTSNTVQLTIPVASTATAGQTFVVKDEGGNAATNAITLSGSVTDTIDGQNTITVDSPYGALSLYTDGENWFIY